MSPYFAMMYCYYEKGILDTASDPSVSGAEIRVALQTGAARVRSDHTPDGGARHIPSLPSDRSPGLAHKSCG